MVAAYILIGVICVAFIVLATFAMCKVSGEADRRSEIMYQQWLAAHNEEEKE